MEHAVVSPHRYEGYKLKAKKRKINARAQSEMKELSGTRAQTEGYCHVGKIAGRGLPKLAEVIQYLLPHTRLAHARAEGAQVGRAVCGRLRRRRSSRRACSRFCRRRAHALAEWWCHLAWLLWAGFGCTARRPRTAVLEDLDVVVPAVEIGREHRRNRWNIGNIYSSPRAGAA